MKGKYEAAFIIPIGANKVLGEDGWEFSTPDRLSTEVTEFLVDTLKLEFSESYLGIDSYVNEKIKMSVFRDDQGRVESIHFHLYGNTLPALANLFRTDFIANKSELFVPCYEKVETGV